MECYAAMGMNDVCLHAAICINQTDMMLSGEKANTKEYKLYDYIFMLCKSMQN